MATPTSLIWRVADSDSWSMLPLSCNGDQWEDVRQRHAAMCQAVVMANAGKSDVATCRRSLIESFPDAPSDIIERHLRLAFGTPEGS